MESLLALLHVACKSMQALETFFQISWHVRPVSAISVGYEAEILSISIISSMYKSKSDGKEILSASPALLIEIT